MNFNQYDKLFRAKASEAGFSEENIIKCLNYAKPLVNAGLPVIYNTSNLSALVGYKKSFIKKAVLYSKYFYRDFKVKKKDGSFRTLSEPLPSLKEIQLWILLEILYNISVSKYAKAYIPGRNIIENVKFHKGKEYIVCLDIENFFPSIKREAIENIFLALGYSSNISNLLSKLCSLNESLPQGAPTSPYLSNLYLKQFDEKVASYCIERKIRFTRYADDLTFSSNTEFDITEFVEKELNHIGLQINRAKIKNLSKNKRQIVTGIVVNEKIQLPKKYRDKIRQEVHFIEKFTLEGHLANTQNARSNYLNHLLGKIGFALQINPTDKKMCEYYTKIKTIMIERGILKS